MAHMNHLSRSEHRINEEIKERLTVKEIILDKIEPQRLAVKENARLGSTTYGGKG